MFSEETPSVKHDIYSIYDFPFQLLMPYLVSIDQQKKFYLKEAKIIE